MAHYIVDEKCIRCGMCAEVAASPREGLVRSRPCDTVDNDRKVQVPAGASVLDAAPRPASAFRPCCHIKELFPSGACRMCVVELSGRPGLVPSCACPPRRAWWSTRAAARDRFAPHDHRAVAREPPLRLPHLREERLLRAAVARFRSTASTGCRSRARPGTTTTTSSSPRSSARPTSASSGAVRAHLRGVQTVAAITSPGAASTPWCCLRSRWT